MIVFLALTSAILFSCNHTAKSQVILKSDSYGLALDTVINTETISFTTPPNSILSGVEGKYRIHFDMANVSGTSTFKVVLHSRAAGCSTCGYSLHYKNAGTTGIQCDTLEITALDKTTFDWDIRPIEGTNAGRAVDFKLYFIQAVTGKTQIKNVSLITQK